MNELQKPLTELEKAQLLEACGEVLKPTGVMLLRRALFELDVLRQEKKS